MLARSLAKVVGSVAALGTLVACGSSLLSSSDAEGAPAAGAAADGGLASGAENPSVNPGLRPVDNAIVLVHAAGLGAFRVCFGAAPKLYPQPDKQTMPEANLVGVDVGTAVRLPPLDTSSDPTVYVYEESLLRKWSAPFGEEYDCDKIVNSQTPGVPPPVVTLRLDTNLATGVNLLVLTGCGANPANPALARTTVQCGDDFDPAKGNLKLRVLPLLGETRPSETTLPTQVVHLSQPLASARADAGTKNALEVSYGPVAGDAGVVFATTSIVKDPALFGGPMPTSPVALPYDPEAQPDYAERGFRVTLGDKLLLGQSLADVARLSSPTDVPSSYYALGSNYVLLLLGDPNAKPRPGDAGVDPLEKLHFLVVPVVVPKADAGADGGT